MTIDKIIKEAIPLNPSCAVERTKEIERRARLRLRIEELLRDNTKPFDPILEYKSMRNE